jgi:hypothetical protein
MATRSDLRTRLQRRLGLGVVSAVEEARLNEAINSGLSRAETDNIPGLNRWEMTGSVLGRLDLTSVTVTQHSATVTVAGAHVQNDHVHPRDILVVVEADGTTTKFLIEDASGSQNILLGIKANRSIAGTSDSYILRRTLELPSTGQIVSILPVGGNNSDGLSREPAIALRRPYAEGTPKYYEQNFSDLHDTSSVSLWPAPTDTTLQWTVTQTQYKPRMASDSDSLEYPEEVLDAILERARDCYLTWTGAANQNDLTASYRALRDTSDALKNSSNPKQIFYKT